ncbi:MAG: HAMP domain-containing histidine kinase, partial [Chloroflexi bacterium]|nr:HAMP domain-containing histidine kinase [Chloroflexota bacterium]
SITSETPDTQLELELLHLPTIICAAIEYLTPAIHDKRQKLVTNLAPELPPICADSLRLEQILRNLLSTASQNTPAGERISLSAYQQNDFVLIDIHYGTPATSPEEQCNVYQTSHDPGHDYTSSNCDEDLNFTLCKYFVELHGGAIQAKRGENEANTFSVFFPFQQGHRPS